ncbi:MAG: M48 family metallopeptidase [Tannerella sp.]|jgi:predicted metal-dependent hydrolase|nr:M48 family metallopeptidase [Tannerella sp.]
MHYFCAMIEYKEIAGGDLGIILMRRNPRARRYTLRVDSGRIYATIPRRGSEREMLSFINQQYGRLLRMLQQSPGRMLLDENTVLQSLTFRLQIKRTSLDNFYAGVKNGILHISCPLQTDFRDERTQQALWKLVEDTLRHEAKRVLPLRLNALAEKYGFRYAAVKITNSRTRWGSCTSRKNINLSLSVMLLPEHLVDYVLLHELCHTVEMNHDDGFWSLMNKVTGGKAATYRKELRRCKTTSSYFDNQIDA